MNFIWNAKLTFFEISLLEQLDIHQDKITCHEHATADDDTDGAADSWWWYNNDNNYEYDDKIDDSAVLDIDNDSNNYNDINDVMCM